MKLILKNTKFFLVTIFSFFIFLLFIYNTIGSDENFGSNLNYGENNVNFSYGGFYAHNLVKLNPQIEVIVYYDTNYQKNVSYVNAFGGIGRNFEISPGTYYKIYSSENINLRLP